MTGRLKGRTALITGAASGIGRAVAQRFIAEGANVVIADIAAAGRVVADSLGSNALFVQCDHTQTDQCSNAVAMALKSFGHLDIVYNNAGGPFTGEFENISDDVLERVLNVNLTGALKMTRAAIPALRESAITNPSGAALLFTSSLQGLKAKPKFSLYTVAKHGLIGLVRSLSLELAPQNIRVNAICPTVIETPMLQAFLPGMASDRETAMQRFRDTIPLGRMPEPEDVAAAALFLASNEARMITGIALSVDGGQMAM